VQSGYKERNWGNQFGWALQERLRRDGAVVDSWQEFYTDGFDKRTWAREAEESPLLEAAARERVVKSQQAARRLSWCCGFLWSVQLSDNAVIIVVSSGVCRWSINPFTNLYPVYIHTSKIMTVRTGCPLCESGRYPGLRVPCGTSRIRRGRANLSPRRTVILVSHVIPFNETYPAKLLMRFSCLRNAFFRFSDIQTSTVDVISTVQVN
jgi:hypothetical protein